LSTENDHLPDNGIETGEITVIGSMVMVATSDEVGSIVGVVVHVADETRAARVKSSTRQRQKISFIIQFLSKVGQ
jgi:hypothetical protein